MKNCIAIILALCLCFCLLPAAGAEENKVTIEALSAANTREALLKNHNSVYMKWADPEDGETYGVLYTTADYTFSEEYCELYEDGALWSIFQEDEEDQLALTWYVMSDEEQADYAVDYRLFEFFNPDAFDRSEIEEISDNGDGTLTITCVIDAEKYEELQKMYGGEITEENRGMSLTLVWTVDAETLEVQSYEEGVELNGESELLTRMVMEYDAPAPEILAWMLDEIEASNNSGTEEQRVITIIYDAGTDAEEAFTTTAGSSYQILPFLREEYQLYSSADRSEVYAGRNEGMSDITLYAFLEE